jgi:hypothetical protein
MNIFTVDSQLSITQACGKSLRKNRPCLLVNEQQICYMCMFSHHVAVFTAATSCTTHCPPSCRCSSVDASWICDCITVCISESLTHQYTVSSKKTPTTTNAKTCCFDNALAICKVLMTLVCPVPHTYCIIRSLLCFKENILY